MQLCDQNDLGLRAVLSQVVFLRVLVRRLQAPLGQVCASLSILAFPSEFPLVCGFQMQAFFLANQLGNVPAGLAMTVLLAGVNPTPSHSKEEVSVLRGVACSRGIWLQK